MNEQDIRLGIAGFGGWGRNVLRAFGGVQGARIAGLCDPDPARLAAARQQHPDAEASLDYAPMVEDPRLDAIVLATPADMHYAMARQALAAGKHVYVEKPLTLGVEEAEELVNLAKRHGRKLMVGHLLEYHPAVNFMKEYIRSGELGEVLYIYARRLNLGVVRRTENAFWSLAPHDISVALYLLDEEPVDVAARGASYLQPGIEDVVFANLTFPGGKMAQIHVSWLDPHKVREIVVVGSHGMLVFDDMVSTGKVTIRDKRATVENGEILLHNGEVITPDIPNDPPLDLEAQHFVDSIRFDRAPRSDGRDGLRVVRILDRVDQILRANRPAEVMR
jgi:predicted dehydrogenase